MCGIAGYIDFRNPPDEATLRSMERVLTHRGPDEGRIWKDGPCGLVHRRLCIIDLSPAAAQPMSNEDEHLWTVFNGEIYNYRPLREELLALGHRFRSRSDTEVILHGYESWGLDLFRRLRGMFAIAIWDNKIQEIILARDRVGKKPMFYAGGPERLIFGSELPVFRCAPNFSLCVSKQALSEYAEFGYVQSPGSILKGVQRLRAGHFAVWNRKSFREEAFWKLPAQPNTSRAENTSAQAAEALEPALREAVICRLESDVPLGCFLSGGIDSSLVAALARQGLSTKLKTYTVGLQDSEMDESPYARSIAAHLGTDHHEIMVGQETLLAEFENILALAPEPIGDDSFVPTHLISRETRKHVTVALSGDGGDELFAGYDKYRQYVAAQRLRRWVPLPWRALARLPWSGRGQKAAEALANAGPRALTRWLSSLWKRNELPELLGGAGTADDRLDFFDQRWAAWREFPDLERWMLTDMETYLEGDILPKVDRASMAVGLETRSPFLDHLFIEQVLRWPNRADPARGGKAILRKILARYVPEELFLRPKRGFGLPVEQWFRGALRPLLLKYTSAKRIQQRGLFRPRPIEHAVRQHLSGRRNFARKLYAMVAFEAWADHFFGEGTSLA
jgi:asparagine synthase (glutamine-hydrolysing)